MVDFVLGPISSPDQKGLGAKQRFVDTPQMVFVIYLRTLSSQDLLDEFNGVFQLRVVFIRLLFFSKQAWIEITRKRPIDLDVLEVRMPWVKDVISFLRHNGTWNG
jgi:hypothetical protein